MGRFLQLRGCKLWEVRDIHQGRGNANDNGLNHQRDDGRACPRPNDKSRVRFQPSPNGKESITCCACGLKGHTAAQCRALGKTIILMYFIKDNSDFCKRLAPRWKQHQEPKAHAMVSEYLEETSLDLTTVVNSLD